MKSWRPGRWIAASMAALGAAAAAVPYLGADGFAATIQQELERVLGRKVELNGNAHFQLFPRPGFSVVDVVIHDDPTFSVEQFAYVPRLEAGVGLASLWRGRIELASLRMEAPSINLMKGGDGRWNVQSLVERARGASAVGALPEIEVSEGRLNFKSEDRKSVYHLAEADVSVETSGDNRLSLYFSGIPARTDRSTHGFGRLSGRGVILLGETATDPGHINLNVALERTAAAEIVTLLQDRGIGLGGFVRSQARLSGPLTRIAIAGRLELDDFERWSWLLPGDAGWGLDYKGALDLDHQTLEIETRAPEQTAAQLPLAVRLRVTRILGDARWGALITARRVPLSSLRALAEETGSTFPVTLPLQGSLTGAFGYSPDGGFRGQVMVEDAAMELPDLPALRFEGLSMLADGAAMSLGPATLRVGDRQTALLEARFDAATSAMDVRLVSNGIALSHLKAGWRQLTGESLPPLLAASRTGTIAGTLRFLRQKRDEPAPWAGELELVGVQLPVAGVAAPVLVESGTLRLKGNEVGLVIREGRVAETPFSAVYTRTAGDRRPQSLRLEIPSVSADVLEGLLSPSLRRDQSFLARTLRFRSAPAPEWMRSRWLAATVRIASFEAGGFSLRNTRALVHWDGAKVEVRSFAANLESGAITAGITALLGAPEPTWRGQFELRGYRWKEGVVDLEASMDSAGLGPRFLSSLRLDGSFSAEDFNMGPEANWRSASGCFTFQTAGGAPRLQLSGLSATLGAENYLGQGVAGADGRLLIELASAQRTLRVPARVNGLSLDFLPAR